MPKKDKKHKEAHCANQKYGMGDHYGTGSKNPVGRMRSDSVGIRPVNKKQIKNPPKSLA